MKNLLMFSFITLVFFTSCQKERLSANGNVISETRNPGNFTGIHTSGSSSIHIVYGNEYKVVVTGSSNLVPYFESRIINEKLYLNYGRVNVKHDDVQVTVILPTVKKISLSGSATVEVSGNFPLIDFIELSISGSGNLVLSSVIRASDTDIDVSGSGTVDFAKLSATRAEVSISGSGDARISVVDRLKASISGSGKIYYGGNPAIESHISGSGKVIKL